ncbi:hypothetical protein, partial [Psychrobacter luti]
IGLNHMGYALKRADYHIIMIWFVKLFYKLFQLGNLSDKLVNLLPSFLCCGAYYIDFDWGVNCFIKGF